MTRRDKVLARPTPPERDQMMSWATVLYSAVPEALGKGDQARYRGQLAEALVGQWIEAGRPRVRPNVGEGKERT